MSDLETTCEFFPCPASNSSGRDCSSSSFDDCQSKKMYEKYGPEPLFIGGCDVIPGLTKEAHCENYQESQRRL